MPGPPFVAGDAIDLCTVEAEDLEFLQETILDPRVRAGLAPVLPRTLDQQRTWFESLGEDDGVYLLVCIGDDPVGSIGLKPPNEVWGVGEVGYFIHPDHWGNGYATEALDRLCDYAFAERRLNKLYAKTYAGNTASWCVLEKVGFREEGVPREEALTEGEHVDLRRYGLLARAWNEERR